MEFIIQRTSLRGDISTQPCKNAYYVDDRGVDNGWYVKLNTLEDLLKLTREVDTSIIINCYQDNITCLEIYDDWRE